ncbi:uncharacterized protein LOC135071401 [Ostrinia nubilalis]|uniref:uncharacterized protein LOC135071401 n=1 Tax=Ostrinia nubilalis TaxID=29057 RepID=UPI0030824C1D
MISTLKDLTVESGCYQKCDYVEYETYVKYIRREKESASSSHYSWFLVHFADNSCMKYRREVLYSWDQMLANLGGIFGLCVGGSIISIIELLWFIIDLAYCVIITKKESRKRKLKKEEFASKLSFKFTNGSKKLSFSH